MVQVDRGEHLRSGEWLDRNREYWESRPAGSDPAGAASGLSVVRPVEGLRVLHLRSGDGAGSVALVERGAELIGVDFSMPAVRRARALALERGVAARSRFVCANVYELRHMLPEPDSFDLVLTSRDALAWLPDIEEWARIVEWFLTPGGSLVLGPASGARLETDDVRTFGHADENVLDALRATGLAVAASPQLLATKPS